MLVGWSTLTYVLFLGVALPPPTPQERANCTAPVYASDYLVCSDRELIELDARAADLAARAGTERLTAGGLEPQYDWFRTRSLCALRSDHRRCLLKTYAARIQVLENLEGLR